MRTGKKRVSTIALGVLLVGSLLVGQGLVVPGTAHAAVPPRACFGTTQVWAGRISVVGYTVGGPNDCPADVEIPSELDGLPVVSVGVSDEVLGRPFQGVTSLTLPSSLLYIAQLGELNVDTLVIPKSVQEFMSCGQMNGDPLPNCI